MIKLIIVDDDKLVREAIKGLLSTYQDIEILSTLESGEQALEYVNNNEVHVVVLDLNMPGLNGYETTRKLKQKHPLTKIVILTVNRSESLPRYLLKAGATAYLTKGCDTDELVLAIRWAVNNRNYINRELSQQIAVNLQTFDQSPFEKLSSREMEVGIMILQSIKSSDIAELLHLSPKTVSTHRTRILEKLGISSDIELFRLAMKYNIIDM